MTPLQQAYRDKQDTLRRLYGGLMTLTDITLELGLRDPKTARRWIADMALPAIQVGRRKRYDTDLVARSLVDRRGMVADG